MHLILSSLISQIEDQVEYWANEDVDMKIMGPMPPGVASKMNYIDHMKSSKYCICPKGYEVNSPQVVEAIFLREPGRSEADFGRFDTKTVVKNIYILFSQSEMAIASENEEIMDLVKPSTPLPSWFTEKDLAEYAALYEKSGFRFALQVPYRSLGMAGSEVQDPKVEAKTLLIIGEKDYVLKSGEVKKYVPDQETIYVPDGSHFVHAQFPDQINQPILTYLHSNRHLASV